MSISTETGGSTFSETGGSIWTDIFTIKLVEPATIYKTPALVIGLSAIVTDERIHKVLGDKVSIWKITVDNPTNNFLRTRSQLSELRRTFRKILDVIKAKHGKSQPLHIFPVMPVSAAVEFGRVKMPKADMSLIIYDEYYKMEGFFKTIVIA